MEELSRQKLMDMLKTMYEIRYFELKADNLFIQGKIHGTMHLSIGQEGVAAGAGAALRPYDYLLNTHRGHGHCIAKGADLNKMMAEFIGKENGYCRGRGGSMHIADVTRNNLGANGIVGGGIALAMGVGLAVKLQKQDHVVLGVFGDGASNQGIFHEALNMASIYGLPVVYLCENNQYAMSTSIRKTTRVENISDRAASYGMPGVTVDGNDIIAVYEAVSAAAERARAGDGPTLVESVTYRWKGHSKNDPGVYRTKEEVEYWKTLDPIQRFRNKLVSDGVVTEDEADAIDKAAAKAIDDAYTFAVNSPEPSVETIMEGVYA